jgi:hypothetical protein
MYESEPMEEKRERRWHTFSIRSLLIAVTVCCVWLGWQMSIVNERKAVKHLLLEHDGAYPPVHVLGPGDSEWPAVPSTVRGWLGDTTHFSVWAYDLTEEEFERVGRAFPEADVDVYDSRSHITAPPVRHRPSEVIKRRQPKSHE